MLAVPFRITRKLSLSVPLLEYLRSNDIPIDIQTQQDLFALDDERAALQCTDNVSVAMPYLSYFSKLVQLEPKFPVHQNQLLDFAWGSICSEKVEWSLQNSVQFERASILFNIGAWYSKLGCVVSLESEDEIRKGNEYFQRSAGTFYYLKDQLSSHQLDLVETCVDFDSALLTFLGDLLLAQSNETVWLMALLKGTLKDTNLAKIASEISSRYLKLVLALEAIPEKTTSLFLKQCNGIAESKYHYYSMQTNIYMAAVASSQHHFGEAVAWWEHALKYLAQVSHLEPPALQALQQQLEEGLRRAQRENDIIYLQPVPTSLPAVPQAKLAAPALAFAMPDAPQFLTAIPTYLAQCHLKFDQQVNYALEQLTNLQTHSETVDRLNAFSGYTVLQEHSDRLDQTEESAGIVLHTLSDHDPLVKDLKTKYTIASKSNRLMKEQLQALEHSARFLEKLQVIFQNLDALPRQIELQREELATLVTRQTPLEDMNTFFRQVVDPIFSDPEFRHYHFQPDTILYQLSEFDSIQSQMDRSMEFFQRLMNAVEGVKPSSTKAQTPSPVKKSPEKSAFPIGKWDGNGPLNFRKG